MAELTLSDVVYSPRSLQVWKTFMNCLAFFYQIFLQILRAVGYHPLLSSSSAKADGFKPLPSIELLDTSPESPTTVEIASSTNEDRFQRLKVLAFNQKAVDFDFYPSKVKAFLWKV